MKETKKKDCVHHHEFVSKINSNQDKNLKGNQDCPSLVTHLLFLGLQVKYIVGGVIPRMEQPVDHGAGPGQSKSLHPIHPPGLTGYVLPVIPTMRAIFKDAALKE